MSKPVTSYHLVKLVSRDEEKFVAEVRTITRQQAQDAIQGSKHSTQR
jgi:hypothetical protein